MDSWILERDFKLIDEWCKENVPKGADFTIDFPHHVYYFAEAEIKDGKLMLYKGSHGWGRDDAFDVDNTYRVRTNQNPFYHYLEKTTSSFTNREGILREFVEKWHDWFKPKFEKKIGTYKSMIDFTA